MSSRNQKKEDLDAFLTTLESKMRGPYSSLDLARIIQTKSLRGSLSAQEYLESISQVLARTDKTTQLRTLVGLLGLEPGQDMDEEVWTILNQAQESPTHEEWVRVIAGLTAGIMYVDVDGEEGTRESCRGDESSELLDKTCKEIVSQTRELEAETANGNGLETADMYPLFVSYRYFLLGPEILDRVIPEQKENPHFQYDEKADILALDDKLEKAKAEEATDHKLISTKPTTAPGAKSSATAAKAQPTLPGMRTGAAKKPGAAAAKARPKSSFMMPSKRTGMGGRGVGRPVPTKGTLHTRKAGAAQSLLGKNKRARMMGTGPGAGMGMAGAGTGPGGRAQKFANNQSKMKMIDVTEVKDLNKEHKERDDAVAKEESKEQKLQARKRKILEAAAEKGLVALPKIRKLEEEVRGEGKANSTGVAGASAAASLQQQQNEAAADNSGDNNDDDNDGGEGTSNEEWQYILKERSNKLADEDRSRIEQFFTNQYNPTPELTVYKMKLHEERTADPVTGQQMKETYYLEIDYSSLTSKQSKKTKRY